MQNTEYHRAALVQTQPPTAYVGEKKKKKRGRKSNKEKIANTNNKIN